ncbi:IGR protein motif-domain-containing protein [Hyaloraphidium curvatum]|nr:IGR protein motif-domain-containing protein [Hyaloraphidium curvatum]
MSAMRVPSLALRAPTWLTKTAFPWACTRLASTSTASQLAPRLRLDLSNFGAAKRVRPTTAERRPIPAPRSASLAAPEAFLRAIGRGCEQYASKLADWDRLFSATSLEMERLGIPVKARKYIMSWREQYRRGRDPVEVKVPRRERAEKKPRPNRVERRAMHSEMIQRYRELRANRRRDLKKQRRLRLREQARSAA